MADNWESQAKALLKEFDKTRDVIYQHPKYKRVLGKCATPICCFPCFLWSFMWRAIACPWMCMCKGAGFMCADNGCTTLSDNCFVVSWTAYDEINKLPKMPEGISKEVLMMILTAIERYDITKSYKLCEMLFANSMEYPTPFAVKELIQNL